MSKPKQCDWCGEMLRDKEPWVRVPVMYDGKPFVYHTRCYIRIFDEDILRDLVTDTDDRYVGSALAKVLHAIDPKRVSAEED